MASSSPSPLPLPSAPLRRRDALALGWDDLTLGRMVRAGVLLRIRHGVYVRADHPAADGGAWQRHRLLVEAAAAMLTDVVARHESAAALWGLPVLGEPPERPRFYRLAARGTPDRTPGADVRPASLDADDVTVADGIVVTSAARTVVDLARERGFRVGVVAADAALRAGVARDALADAARRVTGWPGAESARRAVAFADGRSESPHESITRVAFHWLGLPAPELQQTIRDVHRTIGRVDFLFREERTIAEADGLLKYADPAVLRAEKLREDNLRDQYEVVRILWGEAFDAGDPLRSRMLRAFVRGRARA